MGRMELWVRRGKAVLNLNSETTGKKAKKETIMHQETVPSVHGLVEATVQPRQGQ
jgi:hypothetical protein